MASENLDKILDADERTLAEDHNAIFEKLQTFDPSDVSSLNKMRRLFQVIQKVMISRNQQQEKEINSLRLNLKKHQDPDRLTLSEQLMLSEQLLGNESEYFMLDTENPMKSHLGRQKNSNSNLVQVDLYEMEERIRDLTEENYELHTVINNAKQVTEKYYKQVLQLKREKSELKEEKQMLRQDFIKYRRQVETQWEDLIDNMEEKMQTSRERVTSLETQLTQSTEKGENLVMRFKNKRTECYKLKRELRETIKNLSATRKNNINLKTTLQSEDITNEMLKNMNEELKAKILALQKERKCRDETDEAIMTSVNEKVSEWKKALEEKEEMIRSLQGKVSLLGKQLRDNMRNISDTSIITSLMEESDKKDQRISQLTEKIRFSAEMREKNLDVIKNIRSLFQMKTVSLREEVAEEKNLRYLIEEQLEEVQELVKQAENHAFEKDRDLSETLKRMKKYENYYGLAEAMEEIKSLKRKVQVRDRRIEKLVQFVNQYDADLSQQIEEKENKENKETKIIEKE